MRPIFQSPPPRAQGTETEIEVGPEKPQGRTRAPALLSTWPCLPVYLEGLRTSQLFRCGKSKIPGYFLTPARSRVSEHLFLDTISTHSGVRHRSWQTEDWRGKS